MGYFQILMLEWTARACKTFLDSFERLRLRVLSKFFGRLL